MTLPSSVTGTAALFDLPRTMWVFLKDLDQACTISDSPPGMVSFQVIDTSPHSLYLQSLAAKTGDY